MLHLYAALKRVCDTFLGGAQTNQKSSDSAGGARYQTVADTQTFRAHIVSPPRPLQVRKLYHSLRHPMRILKRDPASRMPTPPRAPPDISCTLHTSCRMQALASRRQAAGCARSTEAHCDSCHGRQKGGGVEGHLEMMISFAQVILADSLITFSTAPFLGGLPTCGQTERASSRIGSTSSCLSSIHQALASA